MEGLKRARSLASFNLSAFVSLEPMMNSMGVEPLALMEVIQEAVGFSLFRSDLMNVDNPSLFEPMNTGPKQPNPTAPRFHY